MEFYVRAEGDPNYDPYKVHSESEIAQVITQIETILFTRKGEVLGDPDFGASIEDLIYTLNYSEGVINQAIEQQIQRYVPLAGKYGVVVETKFYKGTVRDIAQVDITLDSKYQVGVYIN
jgi:hypothetical protein